MKAEIDRVGSLNVRPENYTKVYALKAWVDKHRNELPEDFDVFFILEEEEL